MLARAPDDPFAADVVAVPTRGMERWLSQHMSAVLGASTGRGDGICANVLFPTPHRLTTDAAARACGIDPALDPWLPERAVWPLLAVVEESLDEQWLQALATYLGGADGETYKRARRLTTVAHLTRLFDRYGLHRPAMLAAWRNGSDVDGSGAPLREDACWQPELWRRLHARIGSPDPAQRREQACERLLADPALAELPQRIALFGLTRLPAGRLQILRALARHRDVHLFALHPSARLWVRIEHSGTLPLASPSRAGEPIADQAENRLLASWGRDARELQLVLGAAGEDTDHDAGEDESTATLLERLQHDVREDRRAPGRPIGDGADERMVLADHDRSIEVHACHGRVRQVEVIRDAILHALADDETLEPRDVIVMCPDIESFAPLISATFGIRDRTLEDGELGADDEPRPDASQLRVRLADRALHQTNPVLGAIAALLELVGERLTASQVLDFADREPVRRRFGLHDEDLARIQDWVRDSGIRWGLDAPHRAAYSLQTVATGTWQTGLDRVLVGVAMAENERSFERVLPLDDVDSRAIELAGRLSELIERLTVALDALAATQTLAEWASALSDTADALTATSDRDRWQRSELQRVLDDLLAEAEGAPAAESIALTPGELRAHLGERLQGRPTRANFRTGHLTVCTLEPMRSVPHRVICLLGLDDDAFPRKAPRDGDDLLLDDPWIGERDPRSEDRQLLLDAVMAATERVIITYTGNDERTNKRRPPAVPVGELLDTIDDTARCEGDPATAASVRVRVVHPLQPFDPRNFVAGAFADDRPWSFDADALAGARALELPRGEVVGFLPAPLPARLGEIIELRDLIAFAEHPVRAFLRQRLGVRLGSFDDDVSDALSIELSHLERWAVGRRLLEARLRGAGRREACLAEIDRGLLPPGQLGRRIIEEVEPVVDAIATDALGWIGSDENREPLDVRVRLRDGRLLTGTVGTAHGDVLLTAIYSRVGYRQRLSSWVSLVAATATHPGRELRAVTVGRAGGGDDVRTAEAAITAGSAAQRAEVATEELERLVGLFDIGMREPLPLFSKTSAAYAWAARAGQDAEAEAVREWASGYMKRGGWFGREDEEPEHQLVFGGTIPFSELILIEPGPEESGDGWADEERSRLGRLARRQWDGLLDHEQVSSR